MARHVLIVLENFGVGHTSLQVLMNFSSEGCRQHLCASANAKNGYLSVVSQSGNEQFAHVALRTHGAQLCDGFFTQAEGVDVASAREQKSVNAVEQAQNACLIFGGRDGNGNAACLFDAAVVAFGQLQTLVAEVAGDTDERAHGMVGIMVGDDVVMGAIIE